MQVKKRVCSLEANDVNGPDINSFKPNLSRELFDVCRSFDPPVYFLPSVSHVRG